MPSLRDSTVLPVADPALPCRATTVPSLRDWGRFTAALSQGRAILLSASNIRLLANRKILIWTDLCVAVP
jgi:hypothetical protein